MSRLIDADALERDGWQMSRTVRISKDTMELQTRKPTDFPAIEDAPTIEPQRMRGKWTEVVKYTEQYDINGVKTWASLYQCQHCGFVLNAIEGHIGQYNFCPQCGADMKGGQDETN